MEDDQRQQLCKNYRSGTYKIEALHTSTHAIAFMANGTRKIMRNRRPKDNLSLDVCRLTNTQDSDLCYFGYDFIQNFDIVKAARVRRFLIPMIFQWDRDMGGLDVLG